MRGPCIKGIGDQVVVGCNFAALKIARLPLGFVRVRLSILERLQHEFPAVAPARCTHLPKFRIRHFLVIAARRAEFGMMKDGLALLQFLEHRQQLWRGVECDARSALISLRWQENTSAGCVIAAYGYTILSVFIASF